ncbi:transcription factor vibA [Epichloe bromicola]|uniref:Transcription factor vibA n=1 Tax=Epichloe bromicola TaxID=79588 RepID=A0ABQ0CKY3_9HYPO
MTTAAYPAATMTELRGEPAHSSLWSNYGGSSHLPSRLGSMDSSIHGSSSAHLSARPRGEMQHPYSYNRYSQDESASYERQNSYTGLKRSFSQAEQPAYQEIVHDMRDDGSRLTMNQDHKLLSFRRSQDKSTVVDQRGRVQQLDLSAQLHGMFFLSEMPASTGDGAALQPELTCYRRNLFQISGSLVMPRGQLSVNDANETLPVSNLEVAVSAIESVDGNPVRLIVIPWKTPPPNSPEIVQGPDQEPSPLPLIPFQEDGAEANGEFAVYPIGWRRLQFRIATANNGRRKELQQHFVLHLKVFGTLPDNSKVVLSESITAPIVVRGRSPRNFQARKEIPLLGSSAGSRGQALVETGVGVVASAISLKQGGKARSVDMQVPRSAFTFSPPKPHSSGISAMRSNSYPSWNSQVPSTMAPDSYSKLPLSGSSGFASEPQELPLHTSIPSSSVPLPLATADHGQPGLRSQYNYTTTSTPHIPGSTVTIGSESAFTMPRYMDGNPRPSKSPRHHSHQSIHSNSSIQHAEGPDYRYGSFRGMNSGVGDVSPGGNPPAGRDYYPSANTWTTAAAEPSSTLSYAGHDGRSYPGVPPLKQETPSYNSSARGSFDSMNNYSWTAA